MVSGKRDMSLFVGVGIFWTDLNRTDLGCWRLTLGGVSELMDGWGCAILALEEVHKNLIFA